MSWRRLIRVLRKIDPEAPHEVLLVLDATVGRNALAQEHIFGNAIGVSGIVMTKLDGTRAAGCGSRRPRFGLADQAIGVGEGIDDLQPSTLDLLPLAGRSRDAWLTAVATPWVRWAVDVVPACPF